MALALCMLGTQGCKHTLIICNIYYCSTAKTVKLTRLNVSLYVHCLSFYLVSCLYRTYIFLMRKDWARFQVSTAVQLRPSLFGDVMQRKLVVKSKGKAVPLQARSGPEGSRKLRFPDFMTTAQDGGKVVSLTHRSSLPPGNAPGTHFF